MFAASARVERLTVLARDEDGQPAHPQALIERARWQGRSMGPLARSLETFFTEHGLALATDHAGQLAAGPVGGQPHRAGAAHPVVGRQDAALPPGERLANWAASEPGRQLAGRLANWAAS